MAVCACSPAPEYTHSSMYLWYTTSIANCGCPAVLRGQPMGSCVHVHTPQSRKAGMKELILHSSQLDGAGTFKSHGDSLTSLARLRCGILSGWSSTMT